MYNSVISSKHYISFVIRLENGIFGCHIPRSNCQNFVNMVETIMSSEDYFPEKSIENNTMLIECLNTMENVLFVFQNKANQKKIQCTIEIPECKELIEKMKNVISVSNRAYGLVEEIEDEPWKFFCEQKKEAS